MFDKKSAPFYILNILKEYSDKNHLLKQKDIIDKLHNIYMIDIERKTIATTIDLLISLDYDIVQIPGKGYYLDQREFDETEIKFLIDAIYSSKIIPGDYANDISKKLYSSLSKYQRKDYSYIHKSTEISRSMNNDFFYNIDIINEAINKKKKITFNYLAYDNTGKLIKRKNGYIYKVSPYYLVNNFGKYYLLCNLGNHNDHSNFRLDYITNIELTDENIFPIENIKTLGKDFNITKHINDHVFMFGGNIIEAKIEVLSDAAVTYVYDWFGSNARLKKENDKLYAYIRTDDRAFIYWALQYIELCIVIEPKDVRDKIINILNNSIKNYMGGN